MEKNGWKSPFPSMEKRWLVYRTKGSHVIGISCTLRLLGHNIPEKFPNFFFGRGELGFACFFRNILHMWGFPRKASAAGQDDGDTADYVSNANDPYEARVMPKRRVQPGWRGERFRQADSMGTGPV